MPGPYGSLANPVELDPFQQIVEVHWSTPWLAAKLSEIHLTVTITGEDGTGPGPAYVDPFSYASMTAADYAMDASPLTDFRVFSGGSWSTATGSTEVGGDPSIPSGHTYPLWTWQGVSAFGLQAPVSRFQEPGSGSDLAAPVPPVPGHSTLRFKDVFSAILQLRAQGFVAGGPYPAPIGGTVPMWRTGVTTGSGETIAAVLEEVEIDDVSVSGITLTRAGKIYDVFGSRVVPPSSDTPSDVGEFWVLFKRRSEEVTA